VDGINLAETDVQTQDSPIELLDDDEGGSGLSCQSLNPFE
jgi:hypothetical protein